MDGVSGPGHSRIYATKQLALYAISDEPRSEINNGLRHISVGDTLGPLANVQVIHIHCEQYRFRQDDDTRRPSQDANKSWRQQNDRNLDHSSRHRSRRLAVAPVTSEIEDIFAKRM